MHIILASGIYPPELGGPATYAANLAKELHATGHDVTVVTFGEPSYTTEPWHVTYVSRRGGPLLRWWRYSRALRLHGLQADVVYAFTSVSCGIPLWLAHLKKPKKILRLGGDFLWERYTDWGGCKSLYEFYHEPALGWRIVQWLYVQLLRQFNYLVFSTSWQQKLYAEHFTSLPPSSVLENAVAITPVFTAHTLRPEPALLVYSRLVKVKNLAVLIQALMHLPRCTLTIAGSGPEEAHLRSLVAELSLTSRVHFVGVVEPAAMAAVFAAHDALIIPSLTDISPNTALEAVASGLPVVLTMETGLHKKYTSLMCQGTMRTVPEIQSLLQRFFMNYTQYAPVDTLAIPVRTWQQVMQEHLALFGSITKV